MRCQEREGGIRGDCPPPRALVLWTGGKDGFLALLEARRRGLPIAGLVSLAPRRGSFRAHPLRVQKAQARALALPHRTLRLDPPFDRAYRAAFRALAGEGATHLVTGDIDLVDGRPNWVRACAAGLPLEVVTPLWNRPREELLRTLLDAGIHAVFSCVRPPLPPSLCGRRLTARTLEVVRRSGADLSGENGEYHTMVLDGPGFARRIRVGRDRRTGRDGLTTLRIPRGGLGAS